MRKPTTEKIRSKPYRSECCHVQRHTATNHYGKFYNTQCPKCGKLATWECMEPCPVYLDLPPEWKTVKLGDICEIIG